jgi:hypothetical protein
MLSLTHQVICNSWLLAQPLIPESFPSLLVFIKGNIQIQKLQFRLLLCMYVKLDIWSQGKKPERRRNRRSGANENLRRKSGKQQVNEMLYDP